MLESIAGRLRISSKLGKDMIESYMIKQANIIVIELPHHMLFKPTPGIELVV